MKQANRLAFLETLRGRSFDLKLFVAGLFLILMGHILTLTFVYPHQMDKIDYALLLLSLCWTLGSLGRLGLLLFQRRVTLGKCLLALGAVGLSYVSVLWISLNGFCAGKLVNVQTVANRTFYVYDVSFLDPACRVDLQTGIFLKTLHPADKHCRPESVHFRVHDRQVTVLNGNTALAVYPLY